MEIFITLLSCGAVGLFIALFFLIPSSIKLLYQYERGVVFQLGKFKGVRSKYDVIISAAGGVDLKEARSAIFNGANIVVVNLVRPGDPWEGIRTNQDVGAMASKFLATVE